MTQFDQNTDKLFYFIMDHVKTIQIILKISLNQIKEIFAIIKSFSFHSVFDTDKFETDIKQMHFHPKRFIKRITHDFCFLNKNISCAFFVQFATLKTKINFQYPTIVIFQSPKRLWAWM